jgi:hypothetical protein
VGQVRQEDKANREVLQRQEYQGVSVRQQGLQRQECQGVLVHQEGSAHQEDLDPQAATEIQILEVVLATGCPLGRTESPEEVEVREIQETVVVEVMTLPAVDTRAGQPVRVVHSAA